MAEDQGHIWLGITDEKEEGHFVDIKGSELSWDHWADGEPSSNDKAQNEGWFVC